MMFLYSLKLFGSNWAKALKLFLFYVVIWGVCFALFLPCFFEFKDLVLTNFKDAELLSSFSGVFQTSLGVGLFNIMQTVTTTVVAMANANVGLFVYGLIVLFVFLPFLVNIGKYSFCEMLHAYMTSKAKLGFFSALVKGLRKSVVFSILKTFYNLFFFALAGFALYGLGMVTDVKFIEFALPFVVFLLLVVLFTVKASIVMGWMSALIVFDCNVFVAYHKASKATLRHFWATFATTMFYFVLFWALVLIFGIYTLVVLVPLVSILLCVYNMVMFFTSQGMRFYYNKNNIRTPKKLEEVDNFKKTAYIL